MQMRSTIVRSFIQKMAPNFLGSNRALEEHFVPNKSLFLLLSLMLAWNVYLQVQQAEHSKQIKELYQSHLKWTPGLDGMSHRNKRSLYVEDDTDEPDIEDDQFNVPYEMLSNFGESNEISGSILHAIRSKRDTHNQPTGLATKTHRRKKKPKPKKSTKDTAGAHFVAHIDEERMNREIAEGIEPSIGEHSQGGSLIPRDQIYRFWKPEDWTNNKVFNFSRDSGKVVVAKKGLYLLYAQIVFHGPSARKSYGIHINDELLPYVEAMAFDNIHSRTKRDTSVNGTSTRGRHRRHGTSHQQYSSYSQCNTLAIAQLNRGDSVFIRAMEQKRPVIAKHYLTFWGMVKL